MTIMTGRVDTAEGYKAALRSFSPDVVLSDHSLAQFDSRAALEILRSMRSTTPFIIVTGALSGDECFAAIRAGAEDVVLKQDLRRLPGVITNAILVRGPLNKLTPRQIDVFKLVAEGHRTRDIANRLRVSEKTIESHRSQIMKRLHIHDLVSLVRYATRVGLVSSVFEPLPGSDKRSKH